MRIDCRRDAPVTRSRLKAMGSEQDRTGLHKKEIYELEDDGRVSWHWNH